MHCRSFLWLVFASSIICLAHISVAGSPTPLPVSTLKATQRTTSPSANGPIAFTKNMGQWPDSILFRASAGGSIVWFIRDGVYCQLTKKIATSMDEEVSADGGRAQGQVGKPESLNHRPSNYETAMVKAQFLNANAHCEVIGIDEQAYRCNYFLGNDPSKWRTDVPNYAAVVFKEIYPGVDATFRGNKGRLEYELHGPAEAIAKVRAAYVGGTVITGGKESTVIQTSLGQITFQGLLPEVDEFPVTFLTSVHNSTTLDLVYSTYLGGNAEEGSYDSKSSIAVDDAGCAYVTGCTNSENFPVLDPYQSNQASVGASDVFVTKLSATGNSLIYSTYLGGDGWDVAGGIAVDGSGSAFVTGNTTSGNFPVQNAYQASQASADTQDVFVAKLSADGNSLVFGTYLGGNSYDLGFGIAVDVSDCAYVTGFTRSSNFPTQNPFQLYHNSLVGWDDVFVTKLSAAGNGLVYSTYLGGLDDDRGYGIAVDQSGSAYVTGVAYSSDFPVENPYQNHGQYDAFITKLSAAGSGLVFSTYLGGSGWDEGQAIAVDGAACAYVAGRTGSTDFPTQAPYQSARSGDSYDAFVSKLSATGNSLIYSTYLGGTDDDCAYGIALNQQGNVYVTGVTGSKNFPIRTAYQGTYGGGSYVADAFVTKLLATGDGFDYSTYLGGNNWDGSGGVAVDASGNAYVTGYTSSDNFPVQDPFQAHQGPSGGYDAFVSKLTLTPPCCIGTSGNVNMTGIVDLSDLSLLIAYLVVQPTPVLPCPYEANINETGIIDLADLSLLIAYLTATPTPTLPTCS